MSRFLSCTGIGYLSVSLVLSLGSLSGCGLMRESGVPVPEMEMTETGIATGAVLGAGMGAIVGSVSGQAGMGVAVGSVAGAATGGVIGKALEDQEKRIDAHDSSLGVDTTMRASAGAASSSSSRSKLWARVGEVDSPDSNNLQANRNLPSGDKGIAARYNSATTTRENIDRIPVSRSQLGRSPTVSSEVIQLQQDRSPAAGFREMGSFPEAKQASKLGASKVNTTTENALKLRPSENYFNSDTRIELQKPKPELPDIIDNSYEVSKSATSNLPLPALRKPTLGNDNAFAVGNNATVKAGGLPPAKSRADTQSVQKVEMAKRDTAASIAAVKKEKSSASASQEASRARIAEPVVDMPAVARQETSDTTTSLTGATSKIEKEVVEKAAPVAKVANAPVQAAQGNLSCEKGKKEVERAKNSPSDSDKVFYLRRAILACPEEANLRVELGKVYGRLGLKDDARKEYTAALEADPANDSAQDELSIMMLEGQ